MRTPHAIKAVRRWLDAPYDLYAVAVGVSVGLLVLWVITASGCAIGRRESDGAIIAGLDIGALAESAPQAIAGLANALIPGSGTIIGVLGSVLLGGGVVGHSVASAKAAHTAHQRALARASVPSNPGPAAPPAAGTGG